MYQEYVVGFVFDIDYTKVLLINKNRPDYQKGKLNGIGGHIESDESPKEAMIRECEEESGLRINYWEFLKVFGDKNYRVYVFYSTVDDINKYESKTDEIIEIYSIFDLPSRCMPNVPKFIEEIIFKQSFVLK